MSRANIAAIGVADRATVVRADYRSFAPPAITDTSLYIGNPPYVRHHQIDAQWKTWLAAEAEKHGLSSSGLAGLHVYFFLATALAAQKGDRGALYHLG